MIVKWMPLSTKRAFRTLEIRLRMLGLQSESPCARPSHASLAGTWFLGAFAPPESRSLHFIRRAPRHQVTILRRQVKRPVYSRRDRALLAAASRVLPRNRWNTFLVRPETLLRWHKGLVARK